MIESPAWGELPDLAISEIYGYLSLTDRLNASATCWHWRHIIFQRRFIKSIHFSIDHQNDKKQTFILNQLSSILYETGVTFNAYNLYDIKFVAEYLYRLSASCNLMKLTLRPQVGQISLCRNATECNFINQLLIDPVKCIVQRRSPPLEHLDFGCLLALSLCANDFSKAITRPEKLKVLAIASGKRNSIERISTINDPFVFKRFESLQVLSLDYDHVCNEFLQVIENLSLQKLILHVHNISKDYKMITENAWLNFSNKNPLTEVHLTLISTRLAAELLHRYIFRCNMNLTHLKVLFCEYINLLALRYISVYYQNSIQSLVWVDSKYRSNSSNQRNELDLLYAALDQDQDPIVMMAWTCKHLYEIVLNGYVIERYNLIGICRLKGKDLLKLTIASTDISSGQPVFTGFDLLAEISDALRREWLPIDDEDLHPSLSHYPHSEQFKNEYIMDLVRSSIE